MNSWRLIALQYMLIFTIVSLSLISCSSLGKKHNEIEFLPRYPDAESENIGALSVIPGYNGTVKEGVYTFETKDNMEDVIVYYEKTLSSQDWRIYKKTATEINLIYPNNCPFYSARITFQSRSDITNVAAYLTREPCR